MYSKLYIACVIPIMDYCGGVWGYKPYEKCGSVQNRAIRAFLGVHRYASNVAINGDCGWVSARTRRKLDMLRLWHRLVSMSNDRLTKRIFLWDLAAGKGSWSNEIKEIMTTIGQADLIKETEAPPIGLKDLLDLAQR